MYSNYKENESQQNMTLSKMISSWFLSSAFYYSFCIINNMLVKLTDKKWDFEF